MSDNVQENLVCVFGLGMSGSAAARYLQRIGQKFFVVDTRSNPPGKDEVCGLSNCTASYFAEIPQESLNSAKQIILSPGVSPKINEIELARQMGVDIVGDVELFAQQSEGRIVAITGSNGKSTVADLTYQVLRSGDENVEIGGNFGVPVLDFLPQDTADIYVLELSSFQLDTTLSLKAEVAVLLNVSEDHMDRYASFNEYRNSKLSVFDGAKKCIVNADDELTWPDSKENIVEFSIQQNRAQFRIKHTDDDWILCEGDKEIINARQLSVAGSHNWSNVLATMAIVNALDISLNDKMLQNLANYSGLAHRFQLIASNQDIDWINDSKATNVGATLAALKGIDRNYYTSVVLIAGGDAKGSDLSPLTRLLNEKVDYLILIGKDRALFQSLNLSITIELADDMAHAVNLAYVKLNSSKDNKKAAVLLSPACASSDMYKNFVARGQAFVDAVEASV